MANKISKIVDFLRLERIEENIFRGESKDLGTPQVYGGQVLGQAMQAAQATVEERPVHSVHCYFLRRGDFNAPIVYEVDRSRDGGSFTARRVVAIQHGRPIFTMSASFQAQEAGLDYGRTIEMPPAPQKADTVRKKADKSGDGRHKIAMPTSDFKLYQVAAADKTDPASLQWWMKTRDALPAELDMHQSVLAYVSDFGLLGSSLIPHDYPLEDREAPRPKILFASIDHSIWFHRPCKVDDWLLYYCRSISTSGARGTAQGSIYDSDGVLVATTMQEGLVRQLDATLRD